MLLLGFLSLCQICFLPGYLSLRLFRLPSRGPLQSAIYSFALGLIANHTLVYALSSAGIYSAPVMYGIVTLEWVALFFLTWQDHCVISTSLPSLETLESYRAVWARHPVLGRLISLAAWAAVLEAVVLCCKNFGSVFVLHDDALSWDRWAMDWTRHGPLGTGLYPQLLPANWSITYIMLQNSDIKMFAKAIMPVFTLATLLLFLDLFHKTERLRWLLGLTCYAVILNFFFSPDFLASGYAEVPSAFFAFLTFHAFLQYKSAAGPEANFAGPAMVAVFACGTLLTKQGGIYIFVLAIGWLVVHVIKRRAVFSWRTPAALLLLILLLNWRWVMVEWRVLKGTEFTNIGYLTKTIHGGKTYAQRWQYAWHLIEYGRTGNLGPLVWTIAAGVLLAVFHPDGRLVLLVLFAPFYVLWSLLFSYEARTLALALPFAADCFACGVAAASGFWQKAIRFISDRLPQPAPRLPGPRARPQMDARKAGQPVKRKNPTILAPELPPSRPSKNYRGLVLTWLTACGLLAAVVLIGGTRLTPSALWVWETIVTWKKSLATSLFLMLLAAWLSKRLAPWRLRLSMPVLLAFSAAVITGVQATLLPSHVLLRHQQDARKYIGAAAVNHGLYTYVQQNRMKGKILSDYYFLEILPYFTAEHSYFLFPRPATPEFLSDLLAAPDVGYILTSEEVFPQKVSDWMSENGFKTVFQQQNYRFVELPARPVQTGIHIWSVGFNPPANGVYSGWLLGIGFQRGDILVVNGKDQYPTDFGDDRYETFGLPVSMPSTHLSLELMRPTSGERSRPFRVRLPGT